jgi:hypothetical protein
VSDGTLAAATARVTTLLRAAREVARDASTARALETSTGLSPEGVRLGLSRYLELSPSSEELSTLVGGVAPAASVHVILSANVFVAPLRALAVACAASERVRVKPSRREPVFARALVEASPSLGIALTDEHELAAVAEGEVHVYGRDETVAAVRRAARPGVRVRAHGAGLGVALVSEGALALEAALAVADDVVAFDQRGCLSPRVVLVEGGASRVEGFVDALAARLAVLGREVPRGRLDEHERREATRYLETMTFAGRAVRGESFAIGVSPEGGALTLPPPGRHVHVAGARDLDAAWATLAPLAHLVVAIGCDDERRARAAVRGGSRARISPLGRMQLPPFDGPVDLR